MGSVHWLPGRDHDRGLKHQSRNCKSGQLGLWRNLTSYQLTAQACILHSKRLAGLWICRIKPADPGGHELLLLYRVSMLAVLK